MLQLNRLLSVLISGFLKMFELCLHFHHSLSIVFGGFQLVRSCGSLRLRGERRVLRSCAMTALHLSLLLHLLDLLFQLLELFVFSFLSQEQLLIELFLVLETWDCILQDTDLSKDLLVYLISFRLLSPQFPQFSWLISFLRRYLSLCILQEINLWF